MLFKDQNDAAVRFTSRDMEMINAILENQPLQNMKAAREVQALQIRFLSFCSAHLPGEQKPPKPAKPAKPAPPAEGPAS